MAPSRVLKFDRPDAQRDESPFVLLEAKPRGSKPLDLKIVATEGEFEYSTTLRHDRVGSLRVQNCPASEEEWQTILERLFAHEPQPEIQASASVQRDSSISIIVRKNIQGITQRLGAISIGRDKGNIQIDVLGWCATAVDALSDSRAAAAASDARARDLGAEVAALRAQLDELVRAKREDETALLARFRDLLNEKKVKIREQQKVLSEVARGAGAGQVAGASRDNTGGDDAAVDDDAPAAAATKGAKPRASRGRGGAAAAAAGRGRIAGASRRSKRKVGAAAVAAESSDEDDGGGGSGGGPDKMDVDPKIKTEPEDTDDDAGDTASGNETERTPSTASEDEDEDEAGGNAPPPSAAPAKKGAAQKQQQSQPPPRRNLPFTSRPKPAPAAAPSRPADDDDAETESDDEL